MLSNRRFFRNHHHTNMINSKLLIFTLGIIFIPHALTVCDKPPCVICHYAGEIVGFDYTFSVADVPERCEIVCYSHLLFDVPPTEDEKSAIASLVSANRVLYGYVSYSDQSIMDTIMNSNDVKSVQSQIEPTVTFLKANKFSGIILGSLTLFSEAISNYATKLNTFINILKGDLPSFKVGIIVNGDEYDSFTKSNIFDFSISNTAVDFYLIDTTQTGTRVCNLDNSQTPRHPIKSTAEGVISLEQIYNSVVASSMDENKVWINLKIEATKLEPAAEYGADVSYSEYCQTGPNGTTIWCVDSPKEIYDEITYVKPHFHGIMLSYLDYDDNVGTCECGKFPITNTFIDGWESKALKPCAKIV